MKSKSTAKTISLPRANRPQSIKASESGQYIKLPKPNLNQPIRKG
ncbi:MAG TPA: hypothetical protein VJ836_03650 [Candidatus Saccharimonadales bacterium]|nr:hypothetical protein [Candidatus Saccharimonadales bacterium]